MIVEEQQGEQEPEFHSLQLSWPRKLPEQTLLAFVFDPQEELLRHSDQEISIQSWTRCQELLVISLSMLHCVLLGFEGLRGA